MKINVELEFDENDLGSKWMNPDNLDLLLYSVAKTSKALLKVNSYNKLEEDTSEVMNMQEEEHKRKDWKRHRVK